MTRAKTPSTVPIDINNNKRWATESTQHQSKTESDTVEKQTQLVRTPKKRHPIPVVELASEIQFVDATPRNRSFSTPEALQGRSRSSSVYGLGKHDALGLSPRKRSVGRLEPLQHSSSKGNATSQAKGKPTLRSIKSSPNLQLPENHNPPALDRLFSVEEHEYEYLNNTALEQGYPLRKAKSNLDLTSQNFNGSMRRNSSSYDLEKIPGSPYGSRTGTPRLSSQKRSRSRLLDPIINPPTIAIEEEEMPLSFSVNSSRAGTPHLETLREHAVKPSPVESQGGPDFLLRYPKLSSTHDLSQYLNEENLNHEDLEVFDIKPRADVILNLGYSEQNSPEPYSFFSKPKQAPLAIEYNIPNSSRSARNEQKSKRRLSAGLPGTLSKPETLDKVQHSEVFCNLHPPRIHTTNELKQSEYAKESLPKSTVQITSIQTKESLDVKDNKPFVTMEQLESALSLFADQTSEKLPSGTRGLNESFRSDTQCSIDHAGLFVGIEANKIPNYEAPGEKLLVKPENSVSSIGNPNKNTEEVGQMDAGESKTDLGSAGRSFQTVNGTLPKRGVLSSKAVEATNRLYESPKRTQVRTPITGAVRNNRAKGKGKTSTSTAETGKMPQKLKKKGNQMASKPSTGKAKKSPKVTGLDKMNQKSDRSRIKKGLEYEIKTEHALQRIEGQLNNAKPNRSVSGNLGDNSPENVPSTPVIEDAYPKPDEDDEKLLSKVKVSVPNIPYPRKVKSALPKRSKQLGVTKKGANSKCSPSNNKEVTEGLENPGKLIRAASAGLVIEKGSRGRRNSKDSVVSIGDEFSDYDPDKHTILSGTDWQIIAAKKQSVVKEKTLADPALSVIDEVDSMTSGSFSGNFGSDKVSQMSINVQNNASDKSVGDGEKNLQKNSAGVASLTANSFKTLSLEKPLIVPKTIPADRDPPTDLEIDVIQLSEQGGDLDEQRTTKLVTKDCNPKEADRLFSSHCLEKKEAIVMQNEEVVILDPPDIKSHVETKEVHLPHGEDLSLVQPVRVWDGEDHASENLRMVEEREMKEEDETEDENDGTPDIANDLQKLMKSLRQRSELDALRLANYNNMSEDELPDTDSEHSIHVKHNFVLEEGALSQLFDYPPSPSPTQMMQQSEYPTSHNDKTLESSPRHEVPMKHDVGVFQPRECESRFSDVSDATLRNGYEDFEKPFERYEGDNLSVKFDNEGDPFNSDEEGVQEMLMKLQAEDDWESSIQGAISDIHHTEENDGKVLSDTDTLKPSSRPRLTKEVLKQHNQHQREVLKCEGTKDLLYGIHDQYRVIDRNNMLSRTSTTSQTTDFTQTTDSTKTELDTLACSEWSKGKKLGHGTYGTVYEGLTRDGQLIAVKLIELTVSNRKTAEKEYQQVYVEVELLKTMRHENIVRLLGTQLDGSTVQIFMEHVAGGSIHALLMQYGPLKERIFRKYTRQILTGVNYLHSSSVVHRDIKGSNVMLMPSGTIKLIDFGCAKRLRESSMKNESTESEDGELLLSMRGSPYWMSPEVITSQGHGPKSDIWSVGCTVYEMATTNPPFRELEPTAVMFRIGNGTSMPQLQRPDFSRSAVNFVKKCFIRDPRNRPSAPDLLQHKFMHTRPKSATPK